MAVVNFYKSDLFTIESALNIFNISKSSLYNWIKLYNKSELITQSNIRDSYNSKIGIEIEKYIVMYVKKRCTDCYQKNTHGYDGEFELISQNPNIAEQIKLL